MTLTTPIWGTLNDLEGHLPVAGLFKCNPSNINAAFYQTQLTVCSRGSSATAGLLVNSFNDTACAKFKCASDSLGQCAHCYIKYTTTHHWHIRTVSQYCIQINEIHCEPKKRGSTFDIITLEKHAIFITFALL